MEETKFDLKHKEINLTICQTDKITIQKNGGNFWMQYMTYILNEIFSMGKKKSGVILDLMSLLLVLRLISQF